MDYWRKQEGKYLTSFDTKTDWDQRHQFICSLVDICEKKREQYKQPAAVDPSLTSFVSNLTIKVKVCAQTFENTLKISIRTVLFWAGRGKGGMTKTTKFSPKQDRSQGKGA